MTARLLVDQHGEEAIRVARELAAALGAVGDADSARRWRAIADDATWILRRRERVPVSAVSGPA